MKKEVLLFDLDNTLVNDTENIRHAFKNMVKAFGLEYTDELLYKWILFDKNFWKTMIKQMEIPEYYQKDNKIYTKYVRSLRYYLFFQKYITMKQALDYNETYINDLTEVVVKMPNATQILDHLASKYRMFIVTDGPEIPAYKKLEKANITQYFEKVFSADKTISKTAKPSPLFFEEFLNYIHYFQLEKMIIIGDSIDHDIKLAENVGIESIWYNPGKQDLPSDTKPTYVIQDLLELKRIIS